MIANISAGDLGRKGQKLLVQGVLLVNGTKQSRPTINEDQLARTTRSLRPTWSRMARERIVPARLRTVQTSPASGTFFVCNNFAPTVVVTISTGASLDANTGAFRLTCPLPLTITFSGDACVPSFARSWRYSRAKSGNLLMTYDRERVNGMRRRL